jgi:hypothetical protein
MFFVLNKNRLPLLTTCLSEVRFQRTKLPDSNLTLDPMASPAKGVYSAGGGTNQLRYHSSLAEIWSRHVF